MVQIRTILSLLATTASLVSAAPAAAPAPTARAELSERATTCTFTNAASAVKSKAACATIVLDNIAVPAGTTLDLTKLTSGTHVRISPTSLGSPSNKLQGHF
jgi:galacturan 1,4-alpha-galacturonidase